MRKFLMKFAEFMRDRYARVDAISLACIIASILADIITGFRFMPAVVKLSGLLISSALTVYAIYRPFSKNIWKRYGENEKFTAFLKKVKKWFLLNYRRVRYFNKAVFVRCPRCRAVIKFPRKKGGHRAKCPACGEKFDVNVLFGGF